MIKCAMLLAALLALMPAGIAYADAPASGGFTATSACPALSSIRKSSNPGGVALAPAHTYQVVSANKTPPTHYLVIVPGARPERRWVPVGCGTLGAIGGDAAGASNAAAPKPGGPPNRVPAGAPTHFVLALSWEPGFCAGHRDKAECAAETPSGFDASHFTLHGLWPDPREYCGMLARYIAADKRGDWAALPAVDLSAATRARLAAAMPGTQSLLERHEWIKHGTCSGVAANAYFGRELDFLDAVNASPVRDLFAAAVDKSLSLDAIRAAFNQAFGTEAGQRLRLSCSRSAGARRITELTIALEGEVMGSASLPALISAARPTNGGCDAGLVSAVE